MNVLVLLAAFVAGPVVGFIGVAMGWYMALAIVSTANEPNHPPIHTPDDGPG